MTHGHLISTPLGDVVLCAENDFLTGAFFVGQKHFPSLSVVPPSHPVPAPVRQAHTQLAEFFSGKRRAFTIPFRLSGTPFQQQVWKELFVIPYGTVLSYGTIAERMGLGRGHARAVGSAASRNPVSVIVPCHRVVSGTGHLTGYAGGIDRKRALLMLENALENPLENNADASAAIDPQYHLDIPR